MAPAPGWRLTGHLRNLTRHLRNLTRPVCTAVLTGRAAVTPSTRECFHKLR
jgi:hypothetical protein